MKSPRYRSICYTLFNESVDEHERKIKEKIGDGSFVYAVFQEEKCPDTARLHLQGFICFNGQWSLSKIKQYFGTGIHVERTRGSHKQASDYCKKSDTRESGPYEYGVLPKQGKRSDLDEIRERIEGGTSELEIAQDHFSRWCMYRRSFEAYRTLLSVRRTEKTKLFIFWGAAGTGKTRTVYEQLGYDEVYDLPRPNGGSVWFDGFIGQRCLLIDDFYGWIPLHLLLKLADRYPLRLPRKGGFVEFNAKILVITSNQFWEDWYKFGNFCPELKQALQRRIDAILEFSIENKEEQVREAISLLN